MGRRSIGTMSLLSLVAAGLVLQGCVLFRMRPGGTGATAPAAAASPPPVASAVAGTSPAAASLATPEQLAALLGPDDFAAVGIDGAGAPTFDPNGEPGNVYAVYAGLSGAAGGIEVDVFASGTSEDAATMVQDPGLYAVDATAKGPTGAERATFIGGQTTNDGTAMYDTPTTSG